MSAKKTKSPALNKNLRIVIAAIVFIGLCSLGISYYIKYFSGNVTDKEEYLFIRTGSTFNDVLKTVTEKNIVRNAESFKEAAVDMNYTNNIKSGKYKLKTGVSNRKIINMLKSGNQEPVQLKFATYRLKENFVGKVSKLLEADSAKLLRLLDSSAYVEKFGFDTSNVYTMFIPNSYEMYWNTPAEKFFGRMHAEYTKFWNAERRAKAERLNLTPVKVSILASIVDGEALHDDEMPTIAGLYLNRVKQGIRLQADPTVIFAARDFTIRRVLNKHLRINSPYNTYLNYGLPPGPIMMPSINAIDAVLNHKTHKYLFMCAKEDFSGYHRFAVTQSEHMVNARKFQQALNKRNIKK
ncbi:MAG TPA: endolytic transglycosylase MltG [Sphingobacteriaceae bacterium]|nr:endolytic transglycosylase MltG [Sphingobacteriaceae bacterium]